jgi:galactonate dehydratase
MKITAVHPFFVDHFLLLKIYTDAGIVGIGESGAHGLQEPALAAIEKFTPYLLGQDPMKIEYHWQYLYRWRHFRGAAIMGALSAIDIALWDIAGKYLNVPCYQLMGGKVRDRARVYYHVRGGTKQELYDGCVQAKEMGFTAVGHLTPFLDEPRDAEPYFMSHAQKMRDAINTVGRYRELVGDEVDLCIEIHRRLTPAEAVVLAHGIEPFHPFFYEDPIRPDNFDAMAEVAKKIHIPIATGERIHTIYEFEELLSKGAVQYVRPDVCLAGGLSQSKKIAALAEAHHVGVVPHNPDVLSPVSTAACLQLAACIPNFALQEYPMGEFEPPKSEMVKQPLQVEKGFLIIPEGPGLGIELVEGIEKRYPYRPVEIVNRRHVDGSIVDQ